MFDIVNNFISNLGKIVSFLITIMAKQKLILNTLGFLHNLYGYEVLLGHTCLTDLGVSQNSITLKQMDVRAK